MTIYLCQEIKQENEPTDDVHRRLKRRLTSREYPCKHCVVYASQAIDYNEFPQLKEEAADLVAKYWNEPYDNMDYVEYLSFVLYVGDTSFEGIYQTA